MKNLGRKKPKILIVGDAVVNTGFARVIFEIFNPLLDRYELCQLGTNFFGDPHNWPWKIFPASVGGYETGENRLGGLVQDLQPDLIFMLQDPWLLVKYLEALRSFPQIPTVVYASFNSEEIEPTLPARLQIASRIVVYTEFAKLAYLDAHAKGIGGSLREIEVIHHGVDTEVFYPLARDRNIARKEARQLIFSLENQDVQNGFIVLNANRNQPRKRIDLTMEGFALFVKDKPDNVFLHLHMGMKDLGWDIKLLGIRYGISHRLIFSTDSAKPPRTDSTTLNYIFNAANVGINTTSSEGWGLVSFEQAAAGLAQIVPDHTSGSELWRCSAWLTPYELRLINPYSNINEYIVKAERIAENLEEAWGNPGLLKEKEALCYQNATQLKYQWKVISRQWDAIFTAELNVSPTAVSLIT